MQDTLFAQPFATPLDQTARFSFDEQVAACFPDMIRRSVPGYGQMLAMLPILVAPHCALRQKNADGQAVSRIYDLGCSLGAASLALVQHFAPNRLQIYALDNSAAMIGKAQTIAQQYDRAHEIIFQCTDITTEPLQTCDAIVLNLTLQFIAPAKRFLLLKKCHQALAKGGILLLSEKIHVPNQQDEAWFVGRYYDFKRQNGYSELEISAKRDALDEVLITDTLEAHHWRLQQAGFSKSLTWFRFLNFASLVAFKE